MQEHKIVLLAGKGLSTNIVFNALNSEIGIHSVIIEEKESVKKFLKRRINKLGYVKVAGQILFQKMIVPVLRSRSSTYINTLIAQAGFNTWDIRCNNLLQVSSINEKSVLHYIESVNPDVIIVNGTRILSKRLLQTIKCPVINMHAGITPQYRGVHGAYWALVNNDEENCGVTVHLVDAGVDTGDVLYQAIITVEKKDDFYSYPIKQLLAGVPLLVKAVQEALSHTLKPHKKQGNSQQWYHPTIGQYIYFRILKGIK